MFAFGASSIIVFISLSASVAHGIYLTNESFVPRNDNPAIWTEEEGIWGPVLEDWVLRPPSRRESRVMQIPISEQAYVIQDRVDPEIMKESKISLTKIVSNNSYRPPVMKPPPRQVSETDLYLLGAIEKLVYKVDFMEKRLRRVEEMLYFVMAGNRVDSDPCSENFTRVGKNCYMFASAAGREYDWKVASKQCKKAGAVLAEMETIEENQDVIAHIQSNSHLKGKDFWVGGLNPGLLWIWSNSARPVMGSNSQDNKDNPGITIQGDGRCLRLAYNPALRSYAYKGTDCSTRYSYICEAPENTSSNEIKRIGRSRNVFD
ncbi:hypothetical protein GWI33_006753 [Rhynchophorus ferrugineus]|uniref:C-type lectin domain-containing protein n=1 Tax=Rhynchophorus ferrugineus TaxID=354439 RepID=A0A834IJV4_RHYFE|nr:hypothetical protein GWI33_006753 [Rhynchophorus ferrugineus]